MKVNVQTVEQRFNLYLQKYWNMSEIAPFLLVYLQLLLLFKAELSPTELNVVLERQKQLRGEEFTDEDICEFRKLIRNAINQDLGNDAGTTRKGMLNRLLFCALLDSEEDDFFYLTEPVFEFVRIMKISPDQLIQILESEFTGFKAL